MHDILRRILARKADEVAMRSARAPLADDGRAVTLEATSAGRRVIEAVDRSRHAFVSAVLRNWSREDLEVFAPLLARLAEDLVAAIEGEL